MNRFKDCDEDVAAVTCQRMVFSDKTKRILFADSYHFNNNSVFRTALMLGPTSAPLLRAKFVEAVGGWDEQMEARQDWDLWIRLMKSYKAVFIDEALWIYHEVTFEHIGGSSKRQVNAHERIISKYFQHFEDDIYEYRDILSILSMTYALTGNVKASLTNYLRVLRLKPFMICGNFKLFCKILKRFVRYVLQSNKILRLHI